MNTHEKFLQFNGKNIVFLSIDGTYWIAVRPICDALNVDYTAQLKRIKKDPILGSAYAKQHMQVPFFDQKNRPAFQGREMISLPEKFIYGWLFSINSKSEELINYKLTCYELLYNYFHGTITNRKELLMEKKAVENEIGKLKHELKESDEMFQSLQKLESKKKSLSTQLNKIDKELIKQPELFGTEPSKN